MNIHYNVKNLTDFVCSLKQLNDYLTYLCTIMAQFGAKSYRQTKKVEKLLAS